MPLYLSICESIKKHEASSYLPCWDVNNLHHWSMSQKLPVNNIELIKYTSQIKEGFIKKSIMKKVMKDIFSKLLFNILKNYMNFILIYHFYQGD